MRTQGLGSIPSTNLASLAEAARAQVPVPASTPAVAPRAEKVAQPPPPAWAQYSAAASSSTARAGGESQLALRGSTTALSLEGLSTVIREQVAQLDATFAQVEGARTALAESEGVAGKSSVKIGELDARAAARLDRLENLEARSFEIRRVLTGHITSFLAQHPAYGAVAGYDAEELRSLRHQLDITRIDIEQVRTRLKSKLQLIDSGKLSSPVDGAIKKSLGRLASAYLPDAVRGAEKARERMSGLGEEFRVAPAALSELHTAIAELKALRSEPLALTTKESVHAIDQRLEKVLAAIETSAAAVDAERQAITGLLGERQRELTASLVPYPMSVLEEKPQGLSLVLRMLGRAAGG